jgi:GDP-L-fucose synthase
MLSHQPDAVILAAALVGGIEANRQFKSRFLTENLQIQNSIIEASIKSGVKRLLFLGSSCVYPKIFSREIYENDLLTGPLEESNEGYALAKIAGIKYCQYLSEEKGVIYNSIMPPNLYGPNDNFDLVNSHVLAALMRRFYEAKISSEKTVTVWGSGKPLRQFMHVDDMARACLFALENFTENGILNVGPSPEVSIAELANLIRTVVEFEGEITFDMSKPDGVLRKKLNCRKIEKLGWMPEIDLSDGLVSTYGWLRENFSKGGVRGWI